MGDRFPSMGMKAMLARFPRATHCVQMRVFSRDAVVSFEGPATKAHAQLVLDTALQTHIDGEKAAMAATLQMIASCSDLEEIHKMARAAAPRCDEPLKEPVK